MSTDHKPFNRHQKLPWKATGQDAYVNGVPCTSIETVADEEAPGIPTECSATVAYVVGDHFDTDTAKFIAHACNTYYTREAELSSLREGLKMCVEALDVAMKSLATYGPHTLIELQANNVNTHVKATHPNL